MTQFLGQQKLHVAQKVGHNESNETVGANFREMANEKLFYVHTKMGYRSLKRTTLPPTSWVCACPQSNISFPQLSAQWTKAPNKRNCNDTCCVSFDARRHLGTEKFVELASVQIVALNSALGNNIVLSC